jgi:hypothetical protein
MTAGEGYKNLGACMHEQGVLFDSKNEMMSYTQTSHSPKSFQISFQKCIYIFYNLSKAFPNTLMYP